MKLVKLATTILLMGLHCPALADEYQDAVGKAFPGFQILGRSEIKLDKSRIEDPKIYDQVKDHPGLVVGRFNSDKLTDFAALIRGSRLIHIPENRADMVWSEDYYEGYLVVCLGRAPGGYECTKLKTDPMRIRKPHLGFLTRISPGSEMCSLLWKFQVPKPKRNPNVGEGGEGPLEITFGTDAIGLFGSDSVIYVLQPRGMYLECRVGG
jgi:hypothetical protein